MNRKIGIVIISLLFAASIRAYGETTILLTAFEPFDGRQVNQSAIVAAKMKEAQSLLGPDVHIEVCILPVVYDQGAKAAERCFLKMKTPPTLVLSLGEDDTCNVRLETRAENSNTSPGLPSSAYDDSKIDSFGQRELGFNFPIYRMYCALSPAERECVAVSNNMGNYVCNNTAYHLTEYFKDVKKSVKVQYGFIHVPSRSCDGDRGFSEKNARLLTKMLKSIVHTDHLATTRLPIPSCDTDSGVPVDLSQIKKMQKVLFAAGSPSCDEEFLQELEKAYQPIRQ